MKVCIYKGAEKIVKKSGVGRAMEHQRAILRKVGVEVGDHIDRETDIVHINTVFPGSLFAAIYAKALGKKVLYYGHSTMEDFRCSFKGSNLFAPFFRFWIKVCYNRGDLILTPSDYSRKLLESYGMKRPIFTMSNGIDTEKYRPNPEGRRRFREKYHLTEEKKVILSVGHYIERKGIIDFVELAKAMPEIQFIWFGYTDPRLIPRKIQDVIANAPENVLFPGYVPPEDLQLAYQGCDLFCFMSHEETEGIVVLEALASGIPVLLRDIPVYDGWLKNGEEVYKADMLDEFKYLAYAILDGQLPDLTSQGRQVAVDRSFDNMALRMKELYKSYGQGQLLVERRAHS